MTNSEMLSFLIQHLEGGNMSNFAKRTGIWPSTLSRIMSNSGLTIKAQAPKILAAYPQVNSSWLMTGEGYPGDLDMEVMRSHYLDIIAEKDRHISILMRELEIRQEKEMTSK